MVDEVGVEGLGGPAAEYGRRLKERLALASRLRTRHEGLGYLRLGVAAGFLVTVWFAAFARTWPWWSLAVPAVVFVVVAAVHARVLRHREVAERAAEMYRLGLARMEDRWIGVAERQVVGDVSGSLYAGDLDIVGRGGLFELLSVARTRMGEATLLTWLLGWAGVEEIQERQAAVVELRGRLDFRERMAVAGASAKVGVREEELREWVRRPAVLRQAWMPWVAGVLAVAAVLSAGVWAAGISLTPLLVVLLVAAVVRRPFVKEIAEVVDGTEVALKNLTLMAALLEVMEGERFESARLVAIEGKVRSLRLREKQVPRFARNDSQEGKGKSKGKRNGNSEGNGDGSSRYAEFGEPQAGGVKASAAIARLAKLGEYRASMDNVFVKLLNLPLMYSVQLGFAVERWRRRHGASVAIWIEAVGEMEALLSLATYSYEHPEDVFPEFAGGELLFEAESLGHPLMAAAKCVRNSVRIGGETRVLLISGSNMSGKSTLMRTVGVATVMAMCGAPVRARRMRLTPLRIGASLLMNDSLQGGQSRFYAEIERLSRICRMAEDGGGAGVMFLLDELLQGTNSKDRMVGAQGVVRALVEAGAIGIVTTHDLALAGSDGLDVEGLRSMHFQDEIVNGEMRFDFRLREGVAMRSNGVELMRLIGLKV